MGLGALRSPAGFLDQVDQPVGVEHLLAQELAGHPARRAGQQWRGRCVGGDREVLVSQQGVEEVGLVSGADGLAIDSADRVYITTVAGVQVFDAKGMYLGVIKSGRQGANVAFAGPGKQTLYITAREGLYRVRTLANQILVDQRGEAIEDAEAELAVRIADSLRSIEAAAVNEHR